MKPNPVAVDPETVETFASAKKVKRNGSLIIDCIICTGGGKIYDITLKRFRDCAGCKGTGKMKNPRFKHQHA